MKVLITGATGFIGRMLALRLQRGGHSVVAWVRDPGRAAQSLGADVVPVSEADGPCALDDAVAASDAVVNLAGEPVMGRWTRRRRQRIRDSRVLLTRRIAEAIVRADAPPRVLVSASAVGYYGDRGEQRLDESSEPGQGFLAGVCQQWEQAALAAAGRTRVAIPRIGVVLGAGGGALQAMLPLFRAGLGGRIGSGRQVMPWIHLDDLIEALVFALERDDLRGPFNATSPCPVDNRAFTRALARTLRRPALLPVPSLALRLLLGRGATVSLASTRAEPRRLLDAGFSFSHDELHGALADLLEPYHVQHLPGVAGEDVPDAGYLRRRPPRHMLRQRLRVAAPLDQVFSFFSQAENLGALTPPGLEFAIQTPRPVPIAQGTTIDYRIKLGPFPMTWRTVIERWERGRMFVDAQHRGPYASWWHEHHFRADGEGHTVMEDRVLYAAPLGPLGRIAHTLFIRPMLGRIFGFRARAVHQRFGLDEATDSAAGQPPVAA